MNLRKAAKIRKRSFGDLPRELRDTVYELILPRYTTQLLHSKSYPGVSPTVSRLQPYRLEYRNYPEILATCREIYDEARLVLYKHVRWVLNVPRRTRPWTDGTPSQIRMSLMSNIVNLTLQVRVRASCYRWFVARLSRNKDAIFLEGLPVLERLDLNMILRRRTKRSDPRFDNADSQTHLSQISAVIFWLLRSVPRDVAVLWNINATPESYYLGFDSVFLHNDVLEGLAAEWDAFRGTSPGITPARRNLIPPNAPNPPAFISLISPKIDGAREYRRSAGNLSKNMNSAPRS